jgi:uncharacterized damage-inducible protein DinB
MNAIEQIRRLHQHRMWVNSRLIESARALEADQLRSEMSIGQGSVWRTLTHLLAAEFVWLEALLGNESPVMPGDVADQLPGNQQADDAIESLDELTTCWLALDQRWNEYLQSLSEQSLDDIVYKTSTSSGAGKRHGTSRSDVLLHVCTHAQYTTAQLINMLRQLGVKELPDVMLITLAREARAST